MTSNPTASAGQPAGTDPQAAGQRPQSQPGYAWDARIMGGRAPQVEGYGVGRRSVRGRARTVRAAQHPQGSRVRQPIVLVMAGGMAGAVGWIGMTLAALNVINRDFRFAPGDAPALLFSVVAYLWGIALFSWAWELGDRAKALKLGATIAVAGVAVWLIVAGVAVILALAARGGSGSHGEGGSGGEADAGGVVHGGDSAQAAPRGHDAWERIGYGATQSVLDRLEGYHDRAGDASEDPDDERHPESAEPPPYQDGRARPRDWRGRRSRRRSPP